MAETNIKQLSQLMKTDKVKNQFNSLLDNMAASYISSVVTVVNNSPYLQKVSPNSIILSAVASAALKLPVNPNLGYAAIVPYGRDAQLQIMVNGWVSLAKRSGQLTKLICEPVYEGELISRDRFTEKYSFLDTGCEDESKIIGFMCYLEEANGFRKTIYWTKERIINHGKRFSKTFNQSNGLWQKNFTAMARKTLIKHMLTKYATLSTEMQQALERDEKPLTGTVDDINVKEDDYINEEEHPEVSEEPEVVVTKPETKKDKVKKETNKEDEYVEFNEDGSTF